MRKLKYWRRVQLFGNCFTVECEDKCLPCKRLQPLTLERSKVKVSQNPKHHQLEDDHVWFTSVQSLLSFFADRLSHPPVVRNKHLNVRSSPFLKQFFLSYFLRNDNFILHCPSKQWNTGVIPLLWAEHRCLLYQFSFLGQNLEIVWISGIFHAPLLHCKYCYWNSVRNYIRTCRQFVNKYNVFNLGC